MSARQEDDSFSSNGSDYSTSLNDLNPDYKQGNGHGTQLAQPTASETVVVVPSQHNGKSKERREKSGQDGAANLANGASCGNACATSPSAVIPSLQSRSKELPHAGTMSRHQQSPPFQSKPDLPVASGSTTNFEIGSQFKTTDSKDLENTSQDHPDDAQICDKPVKDDKPVKQEDEGMEGPKYPPSSEISGDIHLEVQYATCRDLVEAQLAELEEKVDIVHPGYDPTFPQTQAQRNNYVRQLISAMLHTDGDDDCNTKDSNGKDPQAISKIKTVKQSDAGLKFAHNAAWEIFFYAVAAQEGKFLLEPHHGLSEEVYSSFELRWVEILWTAHFEKNAAKSQFDALHRRRLATRPQAEAISRGNNKTLNDRRNKQVRLANRVEKSGKSIHDFPFPEENKEGKDLNPSTPTGSRPQKRANSTTKSRSAKKVISDAKQSIKAPKRPREPKYHDALNETPTRRRKYTVHTRADSVIAGLAGTPASPSSASSSQMIPGFSSADIDARTSTLTLQGLSLEEVEKLLSSNPRDLAARNELDRRYRGIVCTLLRTDSSTPLMSVASLTLDELRMYAWGRIRPLQNVPWHYPKLNPPYGHCMNDEAYLLDGTGSSQLFEACSQSYPLFNEHRELVAVGGGHHPQLGPLNLISDSRTEAEDRALGLIPNPLGAIIVRHDLKQEP